MPELKTSDYFVNLAVKCALVKMARDEVERLLLIKDFEALEEFFKSLGRVLVT
ncbi:unnamed protein product [marine sediment metagenome]|uniref:Uncharacterized protein n=1 Tax=marine sediment metagenome TaxID=412755 RepID=X1EWM2_9ZZZZ